MISPHGQLRVYVATRPVDFRKGMDGLALAVQEMMGLDPLQRRGLRVPGQTCRPGQDPGLGPHGHGPGSQAARGREVCLAESAGRRDEDVACAVLGRSSKGSTGALSGPERVRRPELAG